MTQVLYILLAVIAGFGSALQTGLIGQLSRARGPIEAAFISALVSAGGLALVLSARAVKGTQPSLPAPFDNILIYLAIMVLMLTAAAFAIRGVPTYLGFTGALGFFYLFSAAFVAPRIGIALFAAAITAGTMVASVALDHYGAFGATAQRIDGLRVLGVIALMAGVLLIRGR